jgi:hypothetical protein
MTFFESENDLVNKLNEHDSLIIQCARGELSLEEFLAKYNNFPWYYALDGHESDEEERALLRRYVDRIDVHWRLNSEILHHLCADEDAQKEAYIKAGRIGSMEAVKRMRIFVDQHISTGNRRAT